MSRCEHEQMWRWADVKMRRWEGVKMSRCEDEQMWRWAGVKIRCEDEQTWRWADVKMNRCEDEKMWRWADVKMSRCEDEQMWRWEDVKIRRCEDEQMWRWADVKMSRCDGKVWRWADVKMGRCEDEQMWRWEDVKMRGCEDEQMWRWEDVKMRCEDEKMFYRPPLLEEPCAQTLSGKTHIENAYFLRAIFTAVQKCIMDLAGQLSWSARSPQKPSGGDLLTYVFLIFSMRTMMQRLSESKNCQGTSHKHHKVWIEIMWLKHDFHFLTWCWRATNE